LAQENTATGKGAENRCGNFAHRTAPQEKWF
jgi:hypothetical protein